MEYVDDVIDYNKNGSSWTTKYCPKTVDQVIGNNESINFIGNWLLNFETNKIKALHDMKNKKRKRKIKIPDITDADIDEIDGIDGIDDIDKKNDVNDIDNLDDIDDMNNIDDMNDIDEMIEDIEKNKSSGLNLSASSSLMSCVLVIGNHGVGKTCIVNAILKSMGYTKQTINFSKIKKGSDIKDAINDIISGTNILSIMEGTKAKKVAIMIDEIEAISSGSGKTCVITLLKNNIINWTCPIIFISDGQHSHLLTEIKKNSHEVKIQPPFKNEMLTLMKKICVTEKIIVSGMSNTNMNFDNSVAYQVIDHAQKDYRRLILTLYDLKYNYGSTMITEPMFEEYLKLSKKKDEDFNLFKATNSLLQNYDGIENSIRYYETDKVILPLMIQQNYLECITSKTSNNDTRFKLACEIADLLSEGDVIENYIYGEQNWDIHEVHGYYTCVAPSYLLSSTLKKEKYLQLTYPMDLNKASISKINKKNIINASKAFKDKNINDYIYINLIIRYLTSENRTKECIDLLKGYNISVANIESLMKVDKIRPKTSLTSKQKKEISSYLNIGK